MPPVLLPSFTLMDASIEEVHAMCEAEHGYGGAGKVAAYALKVVEGRELRKVAVYAWQPPPPGAACAICPEAPHGVLALSRMAAVPREHRELNHVSKPLRWQMRKVIDRTRWPVLVTYSDEGQGHTGHAYKCSGWAPTIRSERDVYETEDGVRASSYSNGKSGTRELVRNGSTWLQRWEHWIVPISHEALYAAQRTECEHERERLLQEYKNERARAGREAAMWMAKNGWRRVPLKKKWRSGNQAYTYVKERNMSLFEDIGVMPNEVLDGVIERGPR